MILVDTSGLLAALDPSQTHHSRAAEALTKASPPLLLSPFVLAELDYLVTTRVGLGAATDLLREVAGGAYTLSPFTAEEVGLARDVMLTYDNLGIGLADASIVVLARRHDVLDVLTLDARHFRSLRGPRDSPFRILPADA